MVSQSQCGAPLYLCWVGEMSCLLVLSMWRSVGNFAIVGSLSVWGLFLFLSFLMFWSRLPLCCYCCAVSCFPGKVRNEWCLSVALLLLSFCGSLLSCVYCCVVVVLNIRLGTADSSISYGGIVTIVMSFSRFILHKAKGTYMYIHICIYIGVAGVGIKLAIPLWMRN